MPSPHRKQNKKNIGRYRTEAEKRRHFRQRLCERYGLKITLAEYNELTETIKKGGSKSINGSFSQSVNRTAFLIMIQSVEVVVIYDRVHSCLITALPSESKWQPERLIPYRFRNQKEGALKIYKEIEDVCISEFGYMGESGPKIYYTKKYTYPGILTAMERGKWVLAAIWNEVHKQFKNEH